jgi:glycosyltransferase involved in cell wall biosynthesis
MNKNSNKFIIVTPCYNEELLIEEFLTQLIRLLSKLKMTFEIICVDDCSIDNTPSLISNFQIDANNVNLHLIQLTHNSGHQEAIRQGLIHVESLKFSFKGVIVLDSDGEDDINAIKELIEIDEFDIVFVSRGKRSESLAFKFGYFVYKILFRILTSRVINFGNYSLISPKALGTINRIHFFHYSAVLSKQKFQVKKITFNRGKRIDGKSKMNFKGLIFHGLKSMIEFSEEIVFFQLKVFVIVIALIFGISVYLVYSKFIAHDAILGWSSLLCLSLINAALIVFCSIIINLLLLSIKHTQSQGSITYKKLI